MGTKKGCCFLVAYWCCLNCVGSLKVLNIITLWTPNLSSYYKYRDVLRLSSVSLSVYVNCRISSHDLADWKLHKKASFISLLERSMRWRPPAWFCLIFFASLTIAASAATRFQDIKTNPLTPFPSVLNFWKNQVRQTNLWWIKNQTKTQ